MLESGRGAPPGAPLHSEDAAWSPSLIAFSTFQFAPMFATAHSVIWPIVSDPQCGSRRV